MISERAKLLILSLMAAAGAWDMNWTPMWIVLAAVSTVLLLHHLVVIGDHAD